MPLIIDGGRIPPVWAERKRLRAEAPMGSDLPSPACLRLALINNMPDAAMEDTEVQFFELLENAAVHVPVSIKLFSLPGVLRGERGKQRVANLYYGIEELFNDPFDGVIVTGTEPHHPDLRHEPYWGALGEVLDWAERHGIDHPVMPGGACRGSVQRWNWPPPHVVQDVRRICMRSDPRSSVDSTDSRPGAISALTMERGARRRIDGVWLHRPDQVKRSGCRLFCKEEAAEPFRSLSGSSGVRSLNAASKNTGGICGGFYG